MRVVRNRMLSAHIKIITANSTTHAPSAKSYMYEIPKPPNIQKRHKAIEIPNCILRFLAKSIAM